MLDACKCWRCQLLPCNVSRSRQMVVSWLVLARKALESDMAKKWLLSGIFLEFTKERRRRFLPSKSLNSTSSASNSVLSRTQSSSAAVSRTFAFGELRRLGISEDQLLFSTSSPATQYSPALTLSSVVCDRALNLWLKMAHQAKRKMDWDAFTLLASLVWSIK